MHTGRPCRDPCSGWHRRSCSRRRTLSRPTSGVWVAWLSRCSPGSTHGRICPSCKPSSRFVHTRSHRSVEPPLIPLLATGRICQGETLHPGRYLARSCQLLGTHVRARSRTPAVSRGPAQASLGGEHAVRVRSVDLPTVVTRPPISPRSRSDLSTTVNTQYSLAWAILYLPAAYLVKSSRIRCVYLFLSCHNCHEEPALCNTVDPWNTIPLVVFSSSSSFILVPFPLPTWLRAWPPVGSGVLLIPYELHLGRRRDRLRMMLEVRFGPEMV